MGGSSIPKIDGSKNILLAEDDPLSQKLRQVCSKNSAITPTWHPMA